MNLIFFDGPRRSHFLPLAFTRPICDFRIGILTIREKWEKRLGQTSSTITQKYLSEKYKPKKDISNILINGTVCYSDELLKEITSLGLNQGLTFQGEIIALFLNEIGLSQVVKGNFEQFALKESHSKFSKINDLWDIFSLNGTEIGIDYEFLTTGRISAPISDTNTVINSKDIFIEEGATVECSILNANTGKIYIGREAEIMEGCTVRGPLALCEHSGLKMGAKIYGATTLGPHCKGGGEISNSIMFAYSNKGHDGFLGNSVIGEWVNIGADTNNSNLKNNYTPVKLWNYEERRFRNTGLQFCGLIMADHAKCGINTMFNTGTVVGVAANVFGSGFPRNFVPDFSWGGAQGITEHSLNKAFETADAMMKRRGLFLTDMDKAILAEVFNQTKETRI